MSEQAHIPQVLTLFENAAHKKWQFHALVMANRTKKYLSIDPNKKEL